MIPPHFSQGFLTSHQLMDLEKANRVGIHVHFLGDDWKQTSDLAKVK